MFQHNGSVPAFSRLKRQLTFDVDPDLFPWIEGSTEALEGGGNISCSVGPGAGGCFGLMWWEKDSDYEASVWDMKQLASAGMVSTDVNGMSFMPAVVVPVPLIAPTQTTACKRLSDQLRMFLVEGIS